MMRGARCRSRPRPALRPLGAVLLCILCAGCSTGGTTAIATEGGQVSDGRVSDGRVSDGRVSDGRVSDGLATSPPPATDVWMKVSDSIRIDRARGAVRFDATAVIAEGFLEQYVCIAGTRDHESLFAFAGKASEIHAAMLLDVRGVAERHNLSRGERDKSLGRAAGCQVFVHDFRTHRPS